MGKLKSEPPKRWTVGERCRLRSGRFTTEATVALASPNGRSLAVTFEKWLTEAGLHVEGMALLWESDGYRCLHSNELVEVMKHEQA